MRRFALVLPLLLALAALSVAEDAAKELAKVEAQLKKKPDDPTLNYRKAQWLMKLEKFEEGYAAAQKAMECFVKGNVELAWMLLESIDLGHVKVDVHFNMGPKERKRPEMGIVRPLSFRIWNKPAKGEELELLEVIDFEIGMMGGEAGTAAFGITKQGEPHRNLGMLEVDTKYVDLREKAIELIKKRHPASEEKEGEK